MSLTKQALDAYAAKLEKTWSHDRAQTVGASEIGQCVRKIWYLKNEGDSKYGVQRDPDFVESYGARIRGTMFEDHFWEPAMSAKFGDRLLFAGKNQKTLVSDFLSATPDGIIIALTKQEQDAIGVEAKCVTAEAKTADPRTNLVDPKQNNVFQVQVQMGLVRQLTMFNPTHCVLSYADASFWSDIKEFVIPYDEDLFNVAKDRARLIMTATSIDEVAPEGWIAGGRECNYCPFTKACGIQRRNLPFQDEPVEPQFEAEMRDAALAYKAAETAKEEVESGLRAMQVAIKNRMREKGVKKIPGVLNWSSVKGRVSYDNKAIKEAATAAGIDIDQYQTTGEPTDRLQILIGGDK